MLLWISFAIANTAIACASPPAHAIIPQYPECFAFLEFEEGSAELTHTAVDQLNKFAMECSAAYGKTIEIDGHSDASEAPCGGLALSRVRAEAARGYLKSTGVLAQSIQVQAYGDEQPSAQPVGEPYVDAYVHAMNRRVVISLRPTDQK
jgi:outer membrane protein OmpA-like peptidoglycan-associated protein